MNGMSTTKESNQTYVSDGYLNINFDVLVIGLVFNTPNYCTNGSESQSIGITMR